MEEVVWVTGVFFSNLRGLVLGHQGYLEIRGRISRSILDSFFRRPGG
jgi:hypothetical protein